MARKTTGQQRRLGAIEGEVITPGLPVLAAPAEVTDFDGWTEDAVADWLLDQADGFRSVRLTIGLALWVFRDRATEATYTAKVREIATAYSVHVGTLWRWRMQAQKAKGLPTPRGALARSEGQVLANRANLDEGVPSDDTLPGEDQPPDGEDPEGSAEHVSSVSPRVPGAGSTRGAGPPTAQDGGTVPDPGPDGVEPGGASTTAPQEPSPVPASPLVAAADETGSPPPERTQAATAEWLTIIAVTSVEDLRALGHNLVRDAAARLAAADGQKIVTLADWDDMATELRCLREAAQAPPKAPKPAKVTSVASAPAKRTPKADSACGHANSRRIGEYCAICGEKVGSKR